VRFHFSDQPTHPDRDFVPWRFSDACRWSASRSSSCRRPRKLGGSWSSFFNEWNAKSCLQASADVDRSELVSRARLK
jgi:hypothetical protein